MEENKFRDYMSMSEDKIKELIASTDAKRKKLEEQAKMLKDYGFQLRNLAVEKIGKFKVGDNVCITDKETNEIFYGFIKCKWYDIEEQDCLYEIKKCYKTGRKTEVTLNLTGKAISHRMSGLAKNYVSSFKINKERYLVEKCEFD